jgi:hypothetical protein
MEEIAMPVFIPKPEEQVTYFQGVLEHGEQVQAAFWCEQRLFWLVHWLIEELPLGEIIFMSLRHRYFAALTDPAAAHDPDDELPQMAGRRHQP